MEENPLFKQHIKLELCDDLPECSTTTKLSSLPENQLEQNDASLRENGEMCVIVKEDPEIFDAAEFFASKNAFDKNVTYDSDISEDYEDDSDDDVDYYPDNYKKAKWDSNDLDEETDDNVRDSLENHGSKKKLKRTKEKILYAKYTILNYYFIILCPYCGIEIKSRKPWWRHIKSKHNFDSSLQQYYTIVDEFHKECNECKVVLKNSMKILNPHTMSHLPITKIFKCKICSKLHTHTKDMRSHIDTEHIELVSSVLGRGFDVKCRKDSNCDTYGDATNNIQKTESKQITDIYKNQLTKQKKIQQTKDIRSKYMIRLCPFCGKECGSLKANWLAHLKANHDFMNNIDESFTLLNNLGKQCKECEVVLKARSQDLIRHKIAHLPYKQIYKCKICAELRTWAAGLQSHIKRDHNDIVCKRLPSHVENMKGKYCVYCKKNIGCNERFLVHLKKEHDEIYKNKLVLVCPECGVKFSKEGMYRLHIKSDHKFDTFQGLCFEEVFGNMNDEAHRKENEMKYRCLKCNMLFGSCKMGILLTHAITHLPHKNYKCRYCNYSDSSKQKVLKHTCQELLDTFKGVPQEDQQQRYRKNIYNPLGRMNRVDRTNKLYVCPSCGEEFHTAILHAQHLKEAHEFENFESLNISVFVDDMQQDGTNLKYSCNVCNQGFKVSSIRNFRVHAFKHMPFKRYKCTLCQTASNKLSLCPCKDSDTMNGIAFICPHCNDEHFKNEKEWFAHIQEIHADFVTPESLNFEQIHKEDKEQLIYKCNNCGKIIKPLQLNNMLLHALEHMSKKCFKCIMCGRSYDRKGDAIRNVYSCVKRKLTFNKCRDDETPFTKNWRTCSKFAKCQCPVCGFRLENNEDNELVGHLKQVHDFDLESVEHLNFIKCTDSATSEDVQTNYKCSECNQIISDFSIKKLQEHKLAHLPYRMWHCSFCEYEFNSKAQVLYHIINLHLIERNLTKLLHFVCPACNERFDLNTEWRSHMNAKHAFNTLAGVRLEQVETALKCIDCKCTVRVNRKLSHRFRHLPYRPYKCRFCRLTFHTLGYAKTHAKACRKYNEKTKTIGSTKKATKRRDVVNKNIAEVHKTKRIVKFKKKIHPRDEYFAYACPECNVPLPNEELWYVHINEQHGSFSDNLKVKEMPGVKLMCLECNKQIDDCPRARERHKMHHLPYRAFICNICRHRAKSKATLRIHFSRKHFSEVDLKCNICLQVFKTHYEFSTHMKKQHTNIAMWPANLCPICVDFLPDGISVDFHIKINHLTDDIEAFEKETDIKLFLDEQAGLVINNDKAALPANDIPTEMILPDMILSDSPEISNVAAPLFITSMATCSSKSTTLNKFYPYMGYACPECNIALPTQKDWHTHITTSHDFFSEHELNITDEIGETSRSICLECGTKVFGGVLHKQRHKLTHMPYRSFICTICLHRSKNQNGLCDHIKRKHFTPGEYKCEMCLVIFNTAVERYTHAKTEHTEIEWPANVCRICVSTVNRRDMTSHVKIHDYDREQFPCGYCTKYYLSNPERVRHLKAGHPLEYEKEQLEKISENRISRNTEDFTKSLESDIKIELENCDELTGSDYTPEQNVGKTKQKKLRKLLKDKVPDALKRKRGRPRKITESITECSTDDDYKPDINELIAPIKRKRGRPRKIEKDQSNDYKPGINELIAPVKRKRGRPPKIAKDQITMKSVEELDYASSLNDFILPVKEEFHRLDSESE